MIYKTAWNRSYTLVYPELKKKKKRKKNEIHGRTSDTVEAFTMVTSKINYISRSGQTAGAERDLKKEEEEDEVVGSITSLRENANSQREVIVCSISFCLFCVFARPSTTTRKTSFGTSSYDFVCLAIGDSSCCELNSDVGRSRRRTVNYQKTLVL